MREFLPGPPLIAYANDALKPRTARNVSDSAPGTRVTRHVSPPSLVWATVPCAPAAHATRSFTALTA